MATTGLYIFNVSIAMTNMVIALDGVAFDAHGQALDPINPQSMCYSQRAIAQAVRESGATTRLDFVVRTPGGKIDARMNEADFIDGRNAPATVAVRLTRAGHGNVIAKMQALYDASIAEDVAA